MLSSFTIYLTKTMPSSSADNAIMTVGEVAGYLKVTERTIYRLAGAKQIPAFKVGGSWRFSKRDVDEWIKNQSLDGLDSQATEAIRSKNTVSRGDK